jgi:hypothetical protein
MRQESQRPKDTQKSQYFQEGNVDTRETCINKTSCDNEEIHLAPTLSQVGVLIHAETESNNL